MMARFLCFVFDHVMPNAQTPVAYRWEPHRAVYNCPRCGRVHFIDLD